MYPAGVQMRPRRLWSVTSVVASANERAVGITGVNPVNVDEHFTAALFQFRVTAKAALVIGAIRIFGAVDTAVGFPPLGNTTEVLVSSVTDIANNEGLLRVPALHAIDADTKFPMMVLPRHLLLEYTTTGAGSVTFVVDATFIGPIMGARS